MGRDGSIAGLMHAPDAIAGLSPTVEHASPASRQCSRVRSTRAGAQASRAGARGVARTRRGCHADGAIDLDAIERFLSLVADTEVAGDVPDWPALVDALARLYAEPDPGYGRSACRS
jgi:hypothetical protein